MQHEETDQLDEVEAKTKWDVLFQREGPGQQPESHGSAAGSDWLEEWKKKNDL